MTRDPNRIDPILARLRGAWIKRPDLRLGQLLAGSLAIGGFQAEGEAAKITRGVPTVGRIANGAIIEREIDFQLNRLTNLRLALRNQDFTTAKRIAARRASPEGKEGLAAFLEKRRPNWDMP